MSSEIRSADGKSGLRFTNMLLLALCLALLSPPVFGQGKPDEAQANRKWNIRRVERLKDYKDHKGKVRPDLWKKGVEHAESVNISAGVSRVPPGSAKADGPPSIAAAPITGVQWVQRGPQPAFPIEGIAFQGNGAMSGEVVDAVIDPRGLSDDVIYIVSNDGGVWRSTDGGVTFEPKTDNMPSLSMGAITLDPVNPSVVYAGTGNLFDGSSQNTLLAVKAVGIYRSIDMGESWAVINPNNMFDGVGIARMAMPAANTLLVATPSGLFKSVNGGMSFGTAPLYNDGAPVLGGDVEDLDLDVTVPTTVYASVNGSGGGSTNGGIFVSTNAGDTFPTNLFTNGNGSPHDVLNGQFAFVRMAQAASMPTWLYATVQEAGDPDGDADGFGGLYRSTDTGANWTRMAAAEPAGAADGGCQCGYDQTLGVDPRDHLLVYFGFQQLYRSVDGLATVDAVPISLNKIHWDHHYAGFSPPTHWGGLAGVNPTPVWIGTDGGIHSSTNMGAIFNNFHNSTIASNLFHHIDIGRGSPANNDWSMGGTQDTGTLHSCAPAASCGGAALGSGAIPWEMGNNGDGNGVAIDPSNPMRAYSVRNGGYRFTNNGGTNWIAPAAGPTIPPGAWRYAIDSNDPTRVHMITGGVFNPTQQLWRSNDGTGTNWSLINTFNQPIRAIANTPADSNILWFGRTDGRVEFTTNATAVVPTFSGSITIPGNPNNIVSEMAINPLNSNEVVATYRGLCGTCASGDRMKRIFRTADGGTTWADISGTDGNPSGNLPNLSTHSVVYDIGTSPPSIIVSNDFGVFRSGNNGATWQRFGLGLPSADGKMLKIDHNAVPPLLRLGTYGRSVWELSEAQGPILAVNEDLGFDTTCVGENQTRVVQLFNVGSSDLVISAFFRSSGSTQFSIISGPPAPVVIPPGGEIDYTIEFAGTVPGEHMATFQINSNDQFDQSFEIFATGTVNAQMISTVIADAGSYGDVCTANDFHDLNLTIANVGCGMLSVSDISISGADSSDFDMAQVMNYPLNIAAGTSIEIPVRFDPSGPCGDTRSANLNIASDDLSVPSKVVGVSGTVPCPDLNVAIANSGSFGDVCTGDQSDLDLTLFNQGQCDLTIDAIGVDNLDFVLPADLQLPLVLSHDADFNVPIRFAPDMCSNTVPPTPEMGIITIDSDSPGEESLDIDVSGSVPCPNLVIDPTALSGLYSFSATVVDDDAALGCFSTESVAIRNTGACPLTITGMDAGNIDYSVVSPTQFPIELPPGEETLTADIRFTPQSGGSPLSPSEVIGNLAIASDDPDGVAGVISAELCGEGVVQSGVRILVTDQSPAIPVPIDNVDSINISSKGKNTSGPINLTFTDQPLMNAMVCGNPILYHVNQESLPSLGTTGSNPKSSYTAKAREGSIAASQSFTLGQCDFLEFQLQLEDSGSSACLLLPKGDACTDAGECCSGKCNGKAGSKTCK